MPGSSDWAGFALIVLGCALAIGVVGYLAG